jgi:hypothetical protein
MVINPEDKTPYNTQNQEAFVKYLENEYCAKHRHLPVTMADNTLNKNLTCVEMAFRFGQSSNDPYN